MGFFIEMCISLAASMSLVNFGAILFLQNKIDDLAAEIKELKKEKDNA